MEDIRELIEISRYYGADKNYTLAGGGNTSFKNKEFIWIKASGAELATIDMEGFVQLRRDKVQLVGTRKYSDDPHTREGEVKVDLVAASITPGDGRRPSVETSFHEAISYAYVVHTHPTLTNALMCSRNAEKETRRLFGDEVMYISYAPGYALFMKLKSALELYKKEFNRDPHIIFLENHGVFVGAATTGEIKKIYAEITKKIRAAIGQVKEFEDLPVPDLAAGYLPAIRMLLSEEKPVSAVMHNSSLYRNFDSSEKAFSNASLPFTPDMIVYCKSAYMYIEANESAVAVLDAFRNQLPGFIRKHGFPPRIIMIRDHGIIAVDTNAASARTAMEVYDDLLKISYFTAAFGGPHFLEPVEIAFVDNWEVENYRRSVSRGKGTESVVDQRIVIVTGGAQGFGEGIAEGLVKQGANVVVADLNRERGMETVDRLAECCHKNRVLFQQVDVSGPASVQYMIEQTVIHFGGLDVLISNAGILHTGGVHEMDPDLFEKMTRVNYNAWFYCVKAAAAVMKLQSETKPGYTMDLIQVNSKSGLEGSNRNFAYAGAKFGGIGLTQSFALELAPFGIKVNAVCPGNFFEGPLWADPEKGLFVQYLRAGKVPGAKTIEDVRNFYESKVPMKRGCRVEDVLKAICYIIDQQYETGQAVPVTGGQVMLH